MIRSTKHNMKFINFGKKTVLNQFITEYSSYVQKIIDHLWKYGYFVKFPKSSYEFNINNDKFELPSHIPPTYFHFIDSRLSQRAKQDAIGQAIGIIKSVIEKQRRQIYKQEKYNHKTKKINYNKPLVGIVNPQLTANCGDFQLSKDGEFYGFLRLKSIGKSFGHIKIPVVFNKNIKRINGKMKNSFIISNDFVQLAFEIKSNIVKKIEKLCNNDKNLNKLFVKKQEFDKFYKDKIIVGADQGIRTTITFSDGQTTPNSDIHKHTLDNILKRLSKKKKGSKGFHNIMTLRDNFIRWQLNQLDFSNIKTLKLEGIRNLRKYRNTGRYMSHWTYALIREKLSRLCQQNEVRFVEQNPIYRSQRCSNCGFVCKDNRNKKKFCCSKCGNIMDADLNAAKNHVPALPNVSSLFGKGYNIKGFYWKSSGIFDITGQKLIVSD